MSLKPRKNKRTKLSKYHPKSYPNPNTLNVPLAKGETIVERYNGREGLQYVAKDGKNHYDITIALINTSSYKRPYKVVIVNPSGPRTKPEVWEFAGLMSANEFYREAIGRNVVRRLERLRETTPFDTLNPEI